MTSPAGAAAASAVASISADVAAVQARIASLQGGALSSSSSAATSSSPAGQFATVLADAAPISDASTVPGASSSGVTGSAVVADAEKYLGVPYVWGGESNSALDCSGLVQKTFKDLGIDVPRVAADQQKVGTAVSSLADAQPGDLLFFGQPAYHVAIYAGHDKLIESPEPGKTVHVTNVYQTPTSIRRIVPSMTAGVTTAGGLSADQLSAAGLNKSVAAYAAQFANAESQFHLPTGMLAAVAQQESGGNARAVSPAGAQGLMQLMPSTAAGMGVNAFDSSQAINAAAKILRSNLAQFGNSVPLALAAYNAGAGAVHQYGGIPPYSETQNYVRRITSMMNAGG